MAWQSPKTDWSVKYDAYGKYTGDFFTASDYQRIKGNLIEIQQMAGELYPAIILPEIPDVTPESLYYETYINALERSIDALRDGTVDIGFPRTKTWQGNAPAPLAEDYNRIESFCLRLKNLLESQSSARKTMAFTLGGVQF